MLNSENKTDATAEWQDILIDCQAFDLQYVRNKRKQESLGRYSDISTLLRTINPNETIKLKN